MNEASARDEARAPAPATLREKVETAWRRLRGGALSPARAAVSIGVGLFVGCLPLYGVHSVVILALCVPLRLDSAIAYIASHISNPVTAPFLFALELQIGSFILTGHRTELSFAAAKQLGFMSVGARLVVGAAVIAPVTALVGTAMTWFFSLRVQDAREPARAEALKRTLSRYRRAPLSVRFSVWLKLRTDAALESVNALTGSFGRVVEVGCGHGHLGLSLLDRGRGVSLLGIDSDSRRIDTARAAAGTSARFELEDAAYTDLPPSDTILVADSLRYFPRKVQDTVLVQSARALAPGGRLILTEIASGSTWRARLTEWLERRSARRQGHTGELAFRDPESIVRVLEAEGLLCSRPEFESFGVAEAILIVAEKPEPASL